MFAQTLISVALACTALGATAQTASKCQSSFQAAILGADNNVAKCAAIRTYQYCLAEVTGDTEMQELEATRAFAGTKCQESAIKPRIVTRDDKLTFEVDSESDVILSRVRKEKISIVDLASRCETADKKATASIATSEAKLKQGLDSGLASAAAALSSLYTSGVKDLRDGFAKQISDALKEVAASTTNVKSIQTSVNKVIDDLKKSNGKTMDELKKSTDTKIAALDKKVAEAISKGVTSKIADLEGRVRCSFLGAYDAKTKTCKCDKGMVGVLCTVEISTLAKSCATATSTGPQHVSADGKTAVATYCETGIDGGKWELMFNLKTNVAPTLSYNAKFWTEKGKTLGSFEKAMAADYKGTAYNTRKGNKQLMIVAHGQGGNKIHGWAKYAINSKYHNVPMQALFASCGSNCRYTGGRVQRSGQLRSLTRHNSQRSQNEWGDIFIDHGQDIIINRNSGWGSAVNNNRMATSLTNGAYAHTFAGIGGHHEQGKGAWVTDYEAAPISSYCNIDRGYGGIKNCEGKCEAFSAGCKDATFAWQDVSFAVFVRS